MYYAGEGVEMDESTANEWFKKAADAGNEKCGSVSPIKSFYNKDRRVSRRPGAKLCDAFNVLILHIYTLCVSGARRGHLTTTFSSPSISFSSATSESWMMQRAVSFRFSRAQ